MNSSISSSDPDGPEAGQRAARQAGWARFAMLLVGVAAGAMVLMLAFLFVLDPYDTGRPGLIEKPGVRPQGPRTAAASRGRDPAFNAAIFGNSHVQLLSPARLSAATGLSFVSLIAPATHPREQLVLLDWFLRHHRGTAKAIVIGVDGNWCTADPKLPNEKPFPFWLYERSVLTYAAGLIRIDLLEEASRRIDWLRKKNPQRAEPDGYWDYEPNYIAQGYDVRPERRAIFEKPEAAVPLNATGRFPAAERLAEALRELPPEVAVILVVPPLHWSGLPQPGTPLAAADAACKAALQAVANGRRGAALLDWRIDSPQARDASLWFDRSHYRRAVAEAIEADVARALMQKP
jgi:hypothetical protein